jgi:hypothetical protein
MTRMVEINRKVRHMDEMKKLEAFEFLKQNLVPRKVSGRLPNT